MNKNHILVGIAGGVIGFVAALLFAPKSGSALINDFSKSVQKSIHKIKPSHSSHKQHARKTKKKGKAVRRKKLSQPA